MEKFLVLPYLSLAWAIVHAAIHGYDGPAMLLHGGIIQTQTSNFDFQIGAIGGVMSGNITIGSGTSATLVFSISEFVRIG